MPDLFDVLERIVRGLVAQSPGAKLYEPGTIKAWNADGSYTLTDGRTGFPETDQPFTPKDHVHVSQTADGRIVINGPRVT